MNFRDDDSSRASGDSSTFTDEGGAKIEVDPNSLVFGYVELHKRIVNLEAEHSVNSKRSEELTNLSNLISQNQHTKNSTNLAIVACFITIIACGFGAFSLIQWGVQSQIAASVNDLRIEFLPLSNNLDALSLKFDTEVRNLSTSIDGISDSFDSTQSMIDTTHRELSSRIEMLDSFIRDSLSPQLTDEEIFSPN